MCNGKGKDKKGQGKGGRVSSKGGGGRGGAGRGAGNRNVSFADKKLTSTVASFVRKTLLDPGKKEEDEKDSLEEVASIPAAMSASSKPDANGGKSASDNDLTMAAAVKINKIVEKTKDKP